MEQGLSYLALGDSYTVGECVAQEMSFPYQLRQLLAGRGLNLIDPVVIAKTGWTTDELADAIEETQLNDQYDLVTLLIGVNDQYRGYTIERYGPAFLSLLETAIAFSRKGKSRVFVISIPDWGATPFGISSGRSRETITAEIDLFNSVNSALTASAGIKYLNITPISRRGLAEADLLAADGLHPGEKMYKEWVSLLLPEIEKALK